jgi:hypothetical protein
MNNTGASKHNNSTPLMGELKKYYLEYLGAGGAWMVSEQMEATNYAHEAHKSAKRLSSGSQRVWRVACVEEAAYGRNNMYVNGAPVGEKRTGIIETVDTLPLFKKE